MEDFIHFLEASPTAYHATAEICKRLEKGGFTRLFEHEKWNLQKGKGYYVVRGHALAVAFRVPKQEVASLRVLASHVDSPALKLKPVASEIQNGIGRLCTEVYGAPLLHTWFDRDLSVAGKVSVLSKKGEVETHLVCLKEMPVTICSIAPHLDRTINERGFAVNKQDHLKAFFSLMPEGKDLEKALPFKKLLAFDLFLTPLEKPALLGFDKEFLAAYRLDNLTSAYAACQAMVKAKAQASVLQVSFFWDHEEIGSATALGADSVFASEVLRRVALSLQIEEEMLYRIKAQSLCISADLAHGLHPNFLDKHDVTNVPMLGKGVVIKHNANQKYATECESIARVVQIAEENKIPVQSFAARSDIPSGSTVGSMMAAATGIATVDLGIGAWAMHSIREVIAAKDEASLCRLLQCILESRHAV